MTESVEIRRAFPRRVWLTLFLLFALALVSGGYLLYRYEINQLRQERYNDLRAIGSLKVSQIAKWRAEQLEHVSGQARAPLFQAAVATFREPTPSAGAPQLVREYLQMIQNVHRYEDVLLLDPAGQLLLTAAGSATPPPPEVVAQVRENGQAAFSRLYPGPDGEIYLDALAPVSGADGEGVALLAVRSNAATFLYPLIQQWPWPGETAETLLVRVDGEDVLFLNELRHYSGAPLSLRIPLSQSDLPAARAIQGEEGMVTGIDYRGVPVLAHLEPVPDAPWFLVAKWDLSEMAGETGRYAGSIIVIVLLVLLAGGISLGYFYRERQARLYHTLYQAEREQHRLLEEQRAILASIGDGVIATDAASRITYLNPIAETLTGYREEEARGRPLSQVFTIVDPQTRLPREAPIKPVLEAGKLIRLANHTLLLARDGGEYQIADSVAPIRDAEGAVTGAVLVFRDVGERYRMEAALRASERRYRELFANGVSGVALHEVIRDQEGQIVDFRYLDVNPAFETHTGLPLAEVIGRRASDVFPGIENTPFLDIYARVVDSGEPVSFERYFDQLDRHYWIHAYRVEAEQFATVFQDVSERKLAEERLRDRHAELAQVFATMPEAMIYTDPARRIVRVNSAFVEIFGYKPEEMLGRHTTILYADPETFREQDEESQTSDDGARYDADEVRYRRANGETFTGETVASPIWDSQGKVLGTLALIRDVSARKEAEAERQLLQERLAQSQKIESIGRLAGGVAHDFNNMLAVIRGHTELALRRLDAADPLVEDLEKILDAAHRSSTLIRQLLAFARRQTIAPRVIDLNETVAGMLQMLERLIGEDIDLAWRPEPQLWPVKIDPAQVDQILANLCVNARDAITGVGRITVETDNAVFDEAYARTHAGFLQGEYVLLAVSDDGEGIDRETLSHIFEPFFSTKTQGRGTGLGLATVYGIVRQNEGFINVYSEPDQGTSFHIYFPRHEGTVERPEVSRPVVRQSGGEETILLVEDEPAILRVVQSLLEGEGYTVLAADSPSAALSIVQDHTGVVDLLITDVIMPEMSGRELADTMSARYPELSCLFISGYTANAIAHQGVLDEGVDFLQKPFSIEALSDTVQGILGRARPSASG